jgi:hypothetical protein
MIFIFSEIQLARLSRVAFTVVGMTYRGYEQTFAESAAARMDPRRRVCAQRLH